MVQKPDLYKGFLVLSNKRLLRKMTDWTILKNCNFLHIYEFIHIYIYVLHLFTMYAHIHIDIFYRKLILFFYNSSSDRIHDFKIH